MTFRTKGHGSGKQQQRQRQLRPGDNGRLPQQHRGDHNSCNDDETGQQQPPPAGSGCGGAEPAAIAGGTPRVHTAAAAAAKGYATQKVSGTRTHPATAHTILLLHTIVLDIRYYYNIIIMCDDVGWAAVRHPYAGVRIFNTVDVPHARPDDTGTARVNPERGYREREREDRSERKRRRRSHCTRAGAYKGKPVLERAFLRGRNAPRERFAARRPYRHRYSGRNVRCAVQHVCATRFRCGPATYLT